MFSSKFHVVEKYDMDTKDYLESYENIFCEFTPIFDKQYEPELDPNLIDKFGKVLTYKFNNNTIPFDEDSTFFGISYLGGDILNYNIQTNLDYNLVRHKNAWEDFVFKTEINQISSLKSIIDEKICKTDVLTNRISELIFDKDGNITGIGVFDTQYNKTKQNSYLNLLNDFSNNSEKYDNFITFNVGETYTSEIRYAIPIASAKYLSTMEEKNLVAFSKVDYQFYHDNIFDEMISAKIITDEDAEYIRSHLCGERRFTLEYDLDKDENIIQRKVGIITHDLFQKL